MTNTTIMRDSIVGDQWIRDCVAQNPVRRVIDQATGLPQGNDIFTGPVRIAYEDLFELPKPKAGDQSSGDPKFGATILFTPLHDMTLLWEEYYRICSTKFANYWSEGAYRGLNSPFRDQVELARNAGYTPGAMFMRVKSKFPIPVIDEAGNLVVDRSRARAGCWAFCSISAFDYPAQKGGKPGVGFGLQCVQIIGQDKPLGGGGGVDPTKQFAGAKVPVPIMRPDMMAMPSGFSQAPAAAIPGYTNPGGTAGPVPHAPPFQMPTQHYTPPATPQQPPMGNGYAAPTAAYPPTLGQGAMISGAGYAQSATTSPSSGGLTPEEEAELRAMGG